MSWMCEPVEVPVIEHWARCGTCGWSQFCKDRAHAQREADAHRSLHDDIWERSGNTDLGEYLNTTPENVECPTCGGVGHLGPATGSPQRDYGKACPDCTPENVDSPT